MVQSVLRWYIGQCELRSLKYGAKRPQMVHWAMWAKKFKIWYKATSDGTFDKVSWEVQNMVQSDLRWYIGQGELRSLKYHLIIAVSSWKLP
jgi:hypothetical protein